MIGMDQYELIRTANRVYAKSIRAIAREYGHSRKTIRKALAGLEPKYRRKREPFSPVMSPYAGIVEAWLKHDLEVSPKQRHTARRVYTRLVREHGFKGSEVTVRLWVRHCKERLGYRSRDAVIPLDPECAREAEVDWGTAQVWMAGQLVTVKIFCMRSRYSGKSFVRAYPMERQEMFFDGHIWAFAFFGGVFAVIVFDNLKTAVRTVLRGKNRIEQDQFVKFRSYYTFEARFCNPANGREKGGVEGLVGYARRNFLVPLPEVTDYEELNRLLAERCLAHGNAIIKPVQVQISRYQTAMVDRNRYSVPSAHVGRELWAHINCDRIRIYADGKEIADHPRLFSNSKWQIDPQHYLDLISERIQSFESARAIRQWRPNWPAAYETMLSILRNRLGDNKGTRDFVRILQLHKDYSSEEVDRAVELALEYSSYSYDAVKHLLLSQRTPPQNIIPLDPDLIPGITDRWIADSDLNRYDALLTGGAV
jgi:transposase